MSRIDQLEKLLTEMPDDPEVRYMLAMEYASGGNHEEAITRFRDLIARHPDYPPAYHQAGRSLHSLNRINEARKVLEEGIPVALGQGNQHAAGEMQELINQLD